MTTLLVLTLLPAIGLGQKEKPEAPAYPVPFISELSPVSTTPGGDDFTLTVRGTGLLTGQSVIYWNGVALPDPTTCTAAQPPQLASCTATVRAEEIATAGTAEITVVNPDAEPLEGISNVVFFPITLATSSVNTSRTDYAAGKESYSVAVGDFNGDGKLDLAVANARSDNVTILLGNGDGTFTATASSPVTGSGSWYVVVGDFNGDGKLDLATEGAVLLGNGDGTFTAAPSSSGLGGVAAAVGDFNGDGKLDLAVANNSGGDCEECGSVSILLGNGDGTFTGAASFPATGGVWSRSIAVGDFNGDGKLDLAVANMCATTQCLNGSVSILLGNGDG
ncbi:MAG TPA: VCBS repeat-containing protein, partial [Terriglobia bacterium]|nr:VCBS repeat-containing protein [Terriglobia bacterium]